MERVDLTERYIEELPLAKGSPYAARDTRIAGFFVTVGKRKKTFTVQCDVRDDLGRRRTKKVAIGSYPELSVKQARAKAKATIGALQTAARFEERRKGQIKAGMLADFVVLNTDLLTAPNEQLRGAKVQQTWIGGKRVFLIKN